MCTKMTELIFRKLQMGVFPFSPEIIIIGEILAVSRNIIRIKLGWNVNISYLKRADK